MNRRLVSIGAAGIAVSLAHADFPPDYDFQWSVIGAPGNRPTIPDEVPLQPWLEIGAVDYRYRMSRTEVTVRQWYDYVVAYAPFWEGHPNDPDLTSMWIQWNGSEYRIDPGTENWPVRVQFLHAIRYANWLHSDKASTKEAFETGAYDLSTFYQDEDGMWHGQESRALDARFWIPSQDEWVKATYYSPNRYGPGLEGYYKWPHAKEAQIIPGLPEDGGETNAGINYDEWQMDIVSYPWTQSTWGLYDSSGGESEWTETIVDPVLDPFHRIMLGSQIGGSIGSDLLGEFSTMSPQWSAGLRLASLSPEPPIGLLALTLVHIVTRDRRR